MGGWSPALRSAPSGCPDSTQDRQAGMLRESRPARGAGRDFCWKITIPRRKGQVNSQASCCGRLAAAAIFHGTIDKIISVQPSGYWKNLIS